jgi:RNA polymerase sigma-70 factor (ECF subfamily)
MGGRDQDPEDLLRLARLGHAAALGELLERYRDYLALLARLQIGRRLQGKVDAADLVQETFLRAHDYFGRFQGTTEAEFVSWLRKILVTRVADAVRHFRGAKGRDVRLERELTLEADQSSRLMDQALAAPQSTPSHQAARREQAVVVAGALARLPDDYREVIILHQLEDLSFPEVARRMDRTLDSVKNLWLRALVRLRRTLSDGP